MIIDSTLRTMILGTAALGFVSGCLGTFAVLRRQSLIGDAVSHAALPGIVLAFLLAGKLPLVLIVGAALSGLAAMLLVHAITRWSRIPFDSALAGMLAVFFGAGLVLLDKTKQTGSAGLDRYLFGEAATMLPRDVWTIVGIGSISLAIMLLFWKQFKLITFDRGFAAGLGMPVVPLEITLTGLLVVSIVIGLESVGVVLMSALVVAPAAAARQWTNHLSRMTLLAGLFGAVSGIAGSVISHSLSGHSESGGLINVPPGPTIVLCATSLVAFSFLWRTGRQWLTRRHLPEIAK